MTTAYAPTPHEPALALLEVLRRHEAPLDGYPVGALLSLSSALGAVAPCSPLLLLVSTLESWAEQVEHDLLGFPPTTSDALFHLRQRTEATRDALAEMLDLARRLADEDCGHGLHQVATPPVAALSAPLPAPLVAPLTVPLAAPRSTPPATTPPSA